MRWSCLFSLTLLTLPVSAQIDPPITDTLDWQGYLPLQVGNEWHYITENTPWPYDSTFTSFTRYVVQGDTLIQDLQFLLLNDALVRYDTTTASVVERARFSDGTFREICWRHFGCDLDAPFNTYNDEEWFVLPEAMGFIAVEPGRFILAPDTLWSPSYKTLVVELGGITFVHGIGIVAEETEGLGQTRLIYARIDGQEYGDASLLLSSERRVAFTPRRIDLSVYPNPFQDRAQVRYRLDQAAQVEIVLYDLLGRRVESVSAGYQAGGAHEYELESTGLSSGVYLVRLEAGWGRYAHRLVVITR